MEFVTAIVLLRITAVLFTRLGETEPIVSFPKLMSNTPRLGGNCPWPTSRFRGPTSGGLIDMKNVQVQSVEELRVTVGIDVVAMRSVGEPFAT
jgi:hypothetical protein